MATSFSNIKKGLGLLDIIQIGKYKGCRVDSIIEQDDAYLRYMHDLKALVFDASVMTELANKFSTDIKVKKDYYPDSLDQINGFQSGRPSYIFSDMEDDIPFSL